MKYLILAVLAIALLCVVPCEVARADCSSGSCGVGNGAVARAVVRPFRAVAQRQPLRRLFRGTVGRLRGC